MRIAGRALVALAACLALLVALPAFALAAPPVNDGFAAAELVTGTSVTATGTNVEATKETGEPNHAGVGGGGSVWYRWVAPSSGVAVIDTQGSSFDTTLGVYTGTTVDGLTVVAANDQANGSQSRVRISAVEGRAYAIAVDGYYGSRGAVTLHVSLTAATANDAFAAAEILTGTEADVTAEPAAAAREPGEPDHGGSYAQASVWYSWTAPSSGGVTLATQSTGTALLGVYTGDSLGGLVTVAGRAGSSMRVAFRAVEGTTYRIAVDATAPTSVGPVSLSLRLRSLPANDHLAEATVLPSEATASVTGRNDGASTEIGEPSHYGYYDPRSTVWYSWTAPKSGSLTIRATGASQSVVAAYTGDSVGGLGRVTNQAQPCSCGPDQIRVRVTAGVTYRIVVGSYYVGYEGDFTLSLHLIDSPPNDDFANAAPVVGVSADVDGTNVGATQEPGEPIHDDNYYDPSVWYAWTAPTTGGATIDLAGSELNAVTAVYTGDSVSQLTRVPTTRVPGTTRPRRHFRAVAGTTYRIAVDGARAAQGSFHLSLRAAPPPANDMFAAAELLTGSSASATGSNVGASREAGEAGTRDATVWYAWTAPSTGAATAKVTADFGAGVAVYTGTSVEALNAVASGSRPRFTTVAGTTYRIAVDGGTAPTMGDFTLALDHAAAPANDDFENAQAVGGMEAALSGDTRGATRQPGESSHGRAESGASVWYAWTAPASGAVTIATSGSRPGVGVYTGSSVSGLVSIASNRYYHYYSDPLAFRAVAGTTYRIAVESGTVGELGAVQLSLRARPVADNDMFAAATVLPGNTSVSMSGRTDGATAEIGEPSHYAYAAARNSVWYAWTAPKSGSLSVVASGSPRPVLAAYSGTNVSGLTRIPNQATQCPCGSDRIRIRVSAGVTYRIAVDTDYGVGGDFTLGLTLVDSPANDDFANAAPLAGVSVDVDGTNVGATQEVGEPIHDENYYDPSVWYTWTAPSTGGVTIDMAGSTLNAVVGVYTGTSVGALTRVATTRVPGTARAKRRFRAVAGTTYRIAVDGAGAEQATFHLALRVSPPPANDMFASSEPLAGLSANATGSNLGATGEAGEPNSGGTAGASVWYSWTAPVTGAATARIVSADFGASLAVYTGGAVGSLTAAPGSSGQYDGTRLVRFRAEQGTTYRIAVHGGWAPSLGQFALQLDQKPAPANDDFAAAEELTGVRDARSASTEGATVQKDEPYFYGGTASIWYRWTAPVTGRATVDLSGTGYYSSTVGVFTGSSLGSLSRVGRTYSRTLTFAAKAGTTYRIVVDGEYGANGPVKLALSEVETPPNDNFPEATVLRGSVDAAAGTNVNASRESYEPYPTGRTSGASVWYRWRAPAAGPVTVDTAGSAVDTVLGVYTGSSVYDLSTTAANDDAGGTTQSRVTFQATAGTVYRIVVAGAPSSMQGAVRVQVRHSESPANDAFADAQELPGDAPAVAGTSAGATAEADEPDHAGNPGGASVWYRWTAPDDGKLTASSAGSDFDTLLAVYTGAAFDDLTPVAGSDDAGGARTSAVELDVTAGTTYRIAVDGSADDQGPRQGSVALALGFTPVPGEQDAEEVQPQTSGPEPVQPEPARPEIVQPETGESGGDPPPDAGDGEPANDGEEQSGAGPEATDPPSSEPPVPADHGPGESGPTDTSSTEAGAGNGEPGPTDADSQDPDPGSTDAGSTDPDPGPADTGSTDPDPGPADTGSQDPDSGSTDAGSQDPSTDTGPTDTGSQDSGTDTGPTDTGSQDSGTDTGPTDAGSQGEDPDSGGSDPTPPSQPSQGEGSGTPPTSQQPQPGTTTPPPPPPGWSPQLLASATFPAQRLRTVLTRGLVGTASCSPACSVTGAVSLDAATARRVGLGRRTISASGVSAAGARSKRSRVVLRLTPAAKRKLRKVRSARVTVTLRARSGSRTAVVTRRVKLGR